jgi:hypothetical protein
MHRSLRIAAFAALTLLAACQRAGETDGATADTPTAPTDPGVPSYVPPADGTTAAPVSGPQPSQDPADDFVGWYYEKGGKAFLVACGQSISLPVADAAFLRQLNAKRGGGKAPVYVRLGVRPAGSALEVAEVTQFGIDEGPAPNCPLAMQP